MQSFKKTPPLVPNNVMYSIHLNLKTSWNIGLNDFENYWCILHTNYHYCNSNLKLYLNAAGLHKTEK